MTAPPPFTVLGQSFGPEHFRLVVVPVWTTSIPANDEKFEVKNA
jgi:hypothetical protein